MKVLRFVRWPLCIVLPVFVCLFLRYVVFSDVIGGGSTGTVHKLDDARDFALLVEEVGGELDRVKIHNATPAVYTKNLPGNLAKLSVPDKTTIFISLILPNVVRVNDEILETRSKVIALLKKKSEYKRLTRKEQWWLNKVAWLYGCEPQDEKELLLRVDAVPVALAIAQAIDESGWGTSRFAIEGNALYGQHLPRGSKGKYIVSGSGNVKVAAFDSIYEATRSYIHNLNSVWAYKELRRLRANAKDAGGVVSGHTLAAGLERYSELGLKYVRDLRFIIKRYELERLNSVRIKEHADRLVVQFSR